VRGQKDRWLLSICVAPRVIHGAVWSLDEPISWLEGCVLEVALLPDSKTVGIAPKDAPGVGGVADWRKRILSLGEKAI